MTPDLSARPATWRVHLALGRVSNLPTVWSNVVAGTVLAGAALEPRSVLLTGTAASAFYVGGMYLNDAFDREVDRRDRPERPIPSGWIGAGSVMAVGFGLMAAGLASIAVGVALGIVALPALWAALALAVAIVLYDLRHKNNPIAPWVMGLCRGLVYLLAALVAGGTLGIPLLGGATALVCYVAGLTYVARHESHRDTRTPPWPLVLVAAPLVHALVVAPSIATLVFAGALVVWIGATRELLTSGVPGGVPAAVGRLIAAIALVDALSCAAMGRGVAALGALAAFGATRLLHRHVAGT
jgi:4-hydroxybenzoate polyprenyltransferase